MNYSQLFILILLIHFLADFALQTHEQATKKGEGNNVWNKWLFYHVGVYTIIWSITFWFLPIIHPFNCFAGWLIFIVLIGIPHYITDWLTSRMGKPFWKSGDLHNGFVMVGFDQVIHYICLWYVLSHYTNLTQF